MSRHFVDQVGLSPAQRLAKAMVRRAQHLLETAQRSIESIAGEAGFRSASVLREHFKYSVGVSPSVWRRSFGPSA
ncbi:helix-turn-helix domain-containing protein [Acidipila rosea]|uniref:helix-turn-helix domain-containing protein n=1 Tax=Acidipila rosea TaxID=768535 RepID=UPI00104A5555|nr:helix-turn-helix domain-containing protein [Acidobacteriota bacterium]MBW4045876.1 helix-turn-helix domain-containing protein [Acidobacteriota bacterium]